MFNKRLIQKKDTEQLEEKIKKLETRIERLENPYIATIVSEYNRHIDISEYWGRNTIFAYKFCKYHPYKIRQRDIQDQIDDKFKILGMWFDKDQVIFYEDEKKVQEKIEKLIKKLKEKDKKCSAKNKPKTKKFKI